MLRTLLVAGVIAPLGVAAGAYAVPAHAPGPSRAHTAASSGLKVTGYAEGGTPARAIRASAPGLTTVTVDGVSLTDGGADVAPPYSGMAGDERAAHDAGLRAELLVSNYSNRLGDFDPQAAGTLLSSDADMRRVAAKVAGYVADDGYDGVNVDLELVPREDAGGLVRFVRALQAAMPAAKTVSIDVSATTSVRDYRQQGYELAALGRAVDVLQLMAYDQHGPTWSGPGPIGALDWQRRSLAALLTAVPAAKVDLGVGGYGYTWPRHGTGHQVTDAGARHLVAQDGAHATWHPGPGEWSATLSDGTRMWWSDARSYRLRVQMARNQRLHGLAVWVLGSSDPLPAV